MPKTRHVLFAYNELTDAYELLGEFGPNDTEAMWQRINELPADYTECYLTQSEAVFVRSKEDGELHVDYTWTREYDTTPETQKVH